MRTVRLVIFDIGGTIIEDNGEVIASFSAALAANGLTATDAELKELKGSSKRDVIKKFVERQWGFEEAKNEERIRKAYGDFKAALESKFSNGGVKPVAGARATFAWMKANNIASATTTGFYRSGTEIVPSSAGWRGWVSRDELR